jgi:hypothetical protein
MFTSSPIRAIAGVSRWRAAAFLGLAVCAACAPVTSRRQTQIMENTGKVSVSADVLRLRVNDLVNRGAGRIEQTADRIIAESKDDAVRRRALLAKVDVIPALYTAGFRADPLAAAMDVWAFAFQLNQYVESGPGRNAFGPQQPLVLAFARDLLADADAVIKAIAIRPEYFDAARTRVQGWAASNPVADAFSTRASGAAIVADLQSSERDLFVAVGAVSDLLEDLSERLNAYAAQLPKQARWQGEILLTGMAGPHSVEGALADLREVGGAARRAQAFLDDVPNLITTERDMLAAERGAILSDINAQRLQTLEFIIAERRALLTAAREERLAVVAAVQQEREAILAALQQERIVALGEVDTMKTHAVESGLAGFRVLVDYTLWRVALFTSCLALIAGIGAIALFLAATRRRTVVTS